MSTLVVALKKVLGDKEKIYLVRKYTEKTWQSSGPKVGQYQNHVVYVVRIGNNSKEHHLSRDQFLHHKKGKELVDLTKTEPKESLAKKQPNESLQVILDAIRSCYTSGIKLHPSLDLGKVKQTGKDLYQKYYNKSSYFDPTDPSEVLAPIANLNERIVQQEVRDNISQYQEWNATTDDPSDYIEDSNYLSAMRSILNFGDSLTLLSGIDGINRTRLNDVKYEFDALVNVSSYEAIDWPDSFERSVNALLSAFYASSLLSKATPKRPPEEEIED